MGKMSDAAFGGEYAPPMIEKEPRQLARRFDPSTSHRAADGIVHKLRPIQIKVLEQLKAAPDGLTDYELEELCGSHGSTFRSRRAELVEAGLVADSGRIKHLAGSNRIVWIASA